MGGARRERGAAGDLEAIARETGWTYTPGTPVAVARAVYLRLPSDAKLWFNGRRFVDADRALLVRSLAA